MAGELGAVVEGHGPAQFRVQPGEDIGDRSDGFGGGLAGQTGHDGQPRLALVQHQKWSVALANYQIGLPMTRLGSLIRGPGSLRNMRLIGDPVLRSARPAATGRLTAHQIPPELFGLLCRPKNEGMDRLETNCPQTTLDTPPQPPRDLPGRPAFGEAIHYENAKSGVLFQDSDPLATVEI